MAVSAKPLWIMALTPPHGVEDDETFQTLPWNAVLGS
jgi:hypothetical protein